MKAIWLTFLIDLSVTSSFHHLISQLVIWCVCVPKDRLRLFEEVQILYLKKKEGAKVWLKTI